MKPTVDLPKAFSVRDEHEFLPLQHLLARLNPKLTVMQVATGVHINGGSTVHWGVVHMKGQPPTKKEISMCDHGRREAGVFLLGLLVTSDDNLERRGLIVEALRLVPTKACADLLFADFRRVKSSNATRRYLDTVIKVLASMKKELIEDGFAELAADKSFSQRMRNKFRAVIASGDNLGDDWF